LTICRLDFFAVLGYAPRHVPLRHSIRRHYLGRPVAVIVERSIRNRGAASTDCKKRPLKPGGVFHSLTDILFAAGSSCHFL
jgi:hypothetical protein